MIYSENIASNLKLQYLDLCFPALTGGGTPSGQAEIASMPSNQTLKG